MINESRKNYGRLEDSGWNNHWSYCGLRVPLLGEEDGIFWVRIAVQPVDKRPLGRLHGFHDFCRWQNISKTLRFSVSKSTDKCTGNGRQRKSETGLMANVLQPNYTL
jgi:hypothetical protein